uniref:Uncharacterized protein n=1 Tax=Anopheles atroparvus TaxID=41427 RepID=A0AAG5DJU0_ANOAO
KFTICLKIVYSFVPVYIPVTTTFRLLDTKLVSFHIIETRRLVDYPEVRSFIILQATFSCE